MVDDDGDFRQVIASSLAAQGLSVIEAGNGLEALQQVKRVRPAAVVLDLMMPRLGGVGALKRIRAFDPGISVCVVTAVQDEELRRQVTALGAVAVFTKPFPMADLVAALGDSGTPRQGTDRTAPSQVVAADPGARILVVDDDAGVRSLLEEFLTLKGHRPSSASDGAMALRSILEEPPDVVLLDIWMPRLGGLEALTAIRAIAPDTTVIMISGSGHVELAQRALTYGAFDYIAKPFDLAHLAQALETALLMKRV